MTKSDIRRRAASSNPSVAFPALVRLGKARAVLPYSDAGYKSYGTGRLFLPAATNVIPDPQGILADGTFWPASTANTTVTANVAVPIAVPAALAGLTKCLQLVNDGTADTPATANLAVSASTSYFTSLYVYAPTLGGHLHISAENGHSFAVAGVLVANTGWTRYSLATPTVGGETTLHLHLAFDGGTASTVYITGAQVVQEGVLTDFFCGASTLGGAMAWSGTANASTSTRTASVLQYTNIFTAAAIQAAGTIACRSTPLAAGAALTAAQQVTIDQTAGYNMTGISAGADLKWAMQSRDGGGATTLQSGVLGFAANTLHALIGRYTDGGAGTLDLTYDGTIALQAAQPRTLTTTGIIRIGSRQTTTGQEAQGYVGPVAICPARITDAETIALDARLTAGATGLDLFRFFSQRGYTNTVVFPLQGDSVAYKVV